jgi:hypothetical protein
MVSLPDDVFAGLVGAIAWNIITCAATSFCNLSVMLAGRCASCARSGLSLTASG